MSIVRTTAGKPLAAGAAVLVAAAVLAGCSSSPGPAGAPANAVASSSPAAAGGSGLGHDTPASTPPLGGLGSTDSTPGGKPSGPPVAIGAHLRDLLPTAAVLPAGWTIDGDGGESDTGTDINDTDEALLPKEPCTQMRVAGATLTGDFQASAAMNKVTNGKNDVEVRLSAYHQGDAAKVLEEVRAYAARCKTYTGKDWDNKPVPETVTVQAVPGLGDEAIDLKRVPTGPYATDEMITVRVGDRLLSLSGDNIVDQEHMPRLLELATLLAKTAGN
ncbi:hypothetical protein [Streptomyces sp. NRRL WC-3742]|uniref:hypothetical protein n=1 Tax=Streptomyces sp. NRRL WC-3742 TaxID=1463934 RepID=UPI0004C544C7|nr:hypothetical protein [Streptomyces sp. NRRL WC-3742]